MDHPNFLSDKPKMARIEADDPGEFVEEKLAEEIEVYFVSRLRNF